MADQKIRLNPEFSLYYDTCGNHYLVKYRLTPKGVEYSDAYCGYHWSFDYLLQSFIKVKLPEKDAKTVKAALQNLADLQNEVKEFAHQFGQILDQQKKELRDEMRAFENDRKELERYRKEKANAGT